VQLSRPYAPLDRIQAAVEEPNARNSSVDKHQPRFGQVQLAFDMTQNLVTDPVLIAKTSGGPTFDMQCL
jgi:hypothetical protein